MLLADKIVMVTGAASARGIGRATARILAAEGATIVIVDLSAESARAAAHDLGKAHLGVGADVTDEALVAAAVDEAISRFGRIDVLVNNAGITQPVKTLDIGRADYDRILDVNLRGTLICSQAVIPHMIAAGGGSIICISSVSAQRGGGIFGGPHYSAAKAGVLGLAKAMAREFGPQQVRVNAITPGLISTDITAGKLSDEQEAGVRATIPLGRLGHAEDVGNAVLYLASDLSSYLTGVTLDVNGGMLIH